MGTVANIDNNFKLWYDYMSGYSDADSSISLPVICSEKQKQADTTISRLESVLAECFNEDQNDGKKKTKYVLDLDETTRNALDKGLIKLDAGKNGELFAQLRVDGKYGKKLSVKQEVSACGLTPTEISTALQLKAIQEQMQSMMEVLEDIGKDVERVIQGQHNDRIGIFHSGLNLYIEARSVQDDSMRNLLISQALKSVSDSSATILLEIKEEIDFLVNRRYRKVDEIHTHMSNIHRCFDVVYRSYMLKTMIYYERNEIPAMLTTVSEFRRFIERVISKNARKLAECDRNDILLKDGIWETRAKLLCNADSMKYTLSERTTFYLAEGEG